MGLDGAEGDGARGRPRPGRGMTALLRHPTGDRGKVHDITPATAGWSYVGFGLYRLAARRDRRRGDRRHRGDPRPRRGQGPDRRRRARLRRARRPDGRLRGDAAARGLRADGLRLVGDRHDRLHPRRLHRPRQARPPGRGHRPGRHRPRSPAARAPTPATSTRSRWRSATSPTRCSSPRSSPRGQLVVLPAAPPRRGRLPADDLPRGDLLPPPEPRPRLRPAAGLHRGRRPRRDDGRRQTTTSSWSRRATTPAPPPTATTCTT